MLTIAMEDGRAVFGGARELTAGRRRKLHLWPDAFDRLQHLQRQQVGSPRFDLCDLASAAVKVFLSSPEALQQVEKQARRDFLDREMRGDGANP